MPVLSLGYLRLESTDLEAWKTFAGDFLGLMPVAAEGNGGEESLRYRMDHYPPRPHRPPRPPLDAGDRR